MEMSEIKALLYPSDYVESIYEYDFDKAYDNGKRAVLFDIDNTFVPHGAPPDERSLELIGRLKAKGFKLCAVSNNHEPRVKPFCDAAGVDCVFDAGKPSPKGYGHAVSNLGVSAEEAIFFGDQIYTDIVGANRAGIHSVLVRPVDRSTDEIQIRFKRKLEKLVLDPFFQEKGIAKEQHFN